MWSPSNGRNTRRLSAKIFDKDATTYENGVTLMPLGGNATPFNLNKFRPFVVAYRYFFEVLKIPFWNHKSSRIFLKALFYAGLQRSSLRIVRNIEKRGLSESCKPPFNLHRQAEQPDLFDF